MFNPILGAVFEGGVIKGEKIMIFMGTSRECSDENTAQL
jgi:3D (Asp-Asp-Asp) domain-containing protein